MKKGGLVLTYLGLVGMPLIILMGILHAGAHLTPPLSIAGPWNLVGDFNQQSNSGCGALLSNLRQPGLNIAQSGTQLALTLNNPEKTVLLGGLDGSSLTTHEARAPGPAQSDNLKCGDLQQIHLAATIVREGESRTMKGTFILNNCADCQPIRFSGVRQTAQQEKSEQQLVPRVVTIIVQIAVIIIAVRAFGFLFKFIGQPQVIGEMVAGILLGPSLLGWVAPHISAMLFPAASLSYLNTISQIGIVLYMFLVGLALNPKELRGQGHAAVLTSHVSIVVPFVLGALLAFVLYPKLSDDSVSLTNFALFLGAAMSITAFPVLARILTDRNMLGSRLGTLAIACAAVDDVTGWCILAYIIVLIRAQGSSMPTWMMVAGSVAYVLFMIYLVRPLLRRFQTIYTERGWLSENAIASLLLLVLASALITERLGIHLLFGAFLVGAIMPKDRAFSRHILDKFESLTVVLLLPLFFAFTGLRMNLKSVKGGEMWLLCGVIVLVAITGKLFGSMIATRATGICWRDAAALGVLLNTRGLMELVILNIGLDVGVISQVLFSMMVLMALVTTFMTTPLLEWIYPIRLIQKEAAERLQAQEVV